MCKWSLIKTLGYLVIFLMCSCNGASSRNVNNNVVKNGLVSFNDANFPVAIKAGGNSSVVRLESNHIIDKNKSIVFTISSSNCEVLAIESGSSCTLTREDSFCDVKIKSGNKDGSAYLIAVAPSFKPINSNEIVVNHSNNFSYVNLPTTISAGEKMIIQLQVNQADITTAVTPEITSSNPNVLVVADSNCTFTAQNSVCAITVKGGDTDGVANLIASAPGFNSLPSKNIEVNRLHNFSYEDISPVLTLGHTGLIRLKANASDLPKEKALYPKIVSSDPEVLALAVGYSCELTASTPFCDIPIIAGSKIGFAHLTASAIGFNKSDSSDIKVNEFRNFSFNGLPTEISYDQSVVARLEATSADIVGTIYPAISSSDTDLLVIENVGSCALTAAVPYCDIHLKAKNRIGVAYLTVSASGFNKLYSNNIRLYALKDFQYGTIPSSIISGEASIVQLKVNPTSLAPNETVTPEVISSDNNFLKVNSDNCQLTVKHSACDIKIQGGDHIGSAHLTASALGFKILNSGEIKVEALKDFAFVNVPLIVKAGTEAKVQLKLINPAGLKETDTVTPEIISSDNSVLKVNSANCQLTVNKPTCEITIQGVASYQGSAHLIAEAHGFHPKNSTDIAVNRLNQFEFSDVDTINTLKSAIVSLKIDPSAMHGLGAVTPIVTSSNTDILVLKAYKCELTESTPFCDIPLETKNRFGVVHLTASATGFNTTDSKDITVQDYTTVLNSVNYLETGLYIGVGNLDSIIKSSDGNKNWQEVYSQANKPLDDLYSVAYGNNMYIAVGERKPQPGTSEYKGIMISSSDGINWSDLLVTDNPYASITYGNGKFVMVDYTDKAIFTLAANQATWKKINISNNMHYVTYIKDPLAKFIAVGFQGAIASSSDGEKWTIDNLETNVDFLYSVAYGAGANGITTFVAVGATNDDSNGGVIFTSTDGKKWVRNTDKISNDLISVAYGNGIFIAVGRSNDKIFTSTNGYNWKTIYSGIDHGFRSITYANGVFTALGNGNLIAQSSDGGNTWQHLNHIS